MPADLFASARDGAGRWLSRLRRDRAASRRLEVARCGFERSLLTLRDAAREPIDGRDLTGLAIRLCLDRSLGPPQREAA
ncbi:hypothetical protein [Methylorubrum zatmanii]